jgi:hypothetical protein
VCGQAGVGVSETARYVQLLVPMLWVGMVVAISFLEAPIKFRAPGVTLPVGLGIGQLVFKALNIVEVVLLVALSAASVAAATPAAARILLASVAVVLLCQIGVVRPPLRRRSARVLAGQSLQRSRMHWVYIGLELAKVGLLTALAVRLAAG